MSETHDTECQGTQRGAYFDDQAGAVVVNHVGISDKDVVREAQRWTTGERGPLVEDAPALAGADLTAFVDQAMRIGALALSATGQAHEARLIEHMLEELSDKTSASSAKVAEANERAAKDASEVIARAAVEARRAITEADTQNRTELTKAVVAAKEDMSAEVRRLLGGENPELLERLAPVIDRFEIDLNDRVRASTDELLAKAAKQFDPSDPTSPMAKHSAELTARQKELSEQLVKQFSDLTTKVDDLSTAIKVQTARTDLAKVTPIKGRAYESQIDELMQRIAVGLSDEYAATGTAVGKVARSKKGDGVLSISGSSARVVVEMTDSQRANWMSYLDEAERNRDAQASLGLVPSQDQNCGQSIRLLGDRRIIMAFDPEQDDYELLRTVVMLLRAAARASLSRSGDTQAAIADERIREAIEQLEKIDAIKKSTGLIIKHAETVESTCDGINSAIRRLLGHALDALDGATAPAPVVVPVDGAA